MCIQISHWDRVIVPQYLVRKCMADLNGPQFKALLFISDRTIQWRKHFEAISMRHFMRGGQKIRTYGTGLCEEASVRLALTGLHDEGLIESYISDGKEWFGIDTYIIECARRESGTRVQAA